LATVLIPGIARRDHRMTAPGSSCVARPVLWFILDVATGAAPGDAATGVGTVIGVGGPRHDPQWRES